MVPHPCTHNPALKRISRIFLKGSTLSYKGKWSEAREGTGGKEIGVQSKHLISIMKFLEQLNISTEKVSHNEIGINLSYRLHIGMNQCVIRSEITGQAI